MKEKSAKKWLENMTLRTQQILFALLSYVVLLCICIPAVSPEQYDLTVGQVATKTITAPRDVEDTITTKRRREAAADAVTPVYYKDDSIAEEVLSNIEQMFSSLRAVRELGEQIRNTWTSEDENFTEDDYDRALDIVSGISLSNYQLRTLMMTSESDFETLYQSVMSATRTALVSTITEGQVNDAINNIQQIVSYNTRTDLWYNIAIPLLRYGLKPNMLIDQQATEENRQKAYDAVEAVVYKENQNIVVKGNRVTAEQIAVLESLGMLSGNSFNLKLYIGSAGILLMILLCVWGFAYLFNPQVFTMGISALVLLIAGTLTLILCLLTAKYMNLYSMPLMLSSMLVVSLIGSRSAYLVGTFSTMVMTFLIVQSSSLSTAFVMGVVIMGMADSCLSAFLLHKNGSRMYVFVNAAIVGTANFCVLVCIAGISGSSVREAMRTSLYAYLGALVSAILCLGLQPILESAFNLVTPSKLIELSGPNQPLLRRLMIETPGTYHHSMIVANLAEAAAEAIGANALLERVGAYYHDIGKLNRPMYFKENQMGENPHDKMDPRVSAAILTEHTRDGVKLAKSHNLPEPIIDIIQQHHGDTPVMFFYAKAAKLYGEENVDLGDFRYDGPKPQTREAAILMLADTCEAAVRSMQDHNREKISEMIRKLVRGKMEDGQLDECPLTFRDIEKICLAFENALQGVYHERIKYPTVDLEKARRLEAEHNEQQEQEKNGDGK